MLDLLATAMAMATRGSPALILGPSICQRVVGGISLCKGSFPLSPAKSSPRCLSPTYPLSLQHPHLVSLPHEFHNGQILHFEDLWFLLLLLAFDLTPYVLKIWAVLLAPGSCL